MNTINQIEHYTKPLKSSGSISWLDFGSLLKYSRGGVDELSASITEGDDLDIGLLYEKKKIEGIITELRIIFDEVAEIKLCGIPIMIKCWSTGKNSYGKFHLDVSIYHKTMNGYVTLLPIRRGTVCRGYKNFVSKLILIPSYVFNIFKNYKWPKNISRRGLTSCAFQIGVVSLKSSFDPKKISSKTDILEFPVPQNPNEYLTNRYGDWISPNKKWFWARDQLDLQICDTITAAEIVLACKNVWS